MFARSMEPDSPDESGRGRGTLVLYLGTVAAYADMYLTQPILPLLSREFGVGPARAGFTVSAVVLAIAAASSFYGPLSDVLGRKRVMVGATAPSPSITSAGRSAPSFRGSRGRRRAGRACWGAAWPRPGWGCWPTRSCAAGSECSRCCYTREGGFDSRRFQ